MLESDLETRFLQWCRVKEIHCLKLTGPKGFPDRTLVLPNGITVFVELKRPGGILSPWQIEWLNRLQRQGCMAFAADNLDDLIFQTELALTAKVDSPWG